MFPFIIRACFLLAAVMYCTASLHAQQIQKVIVGYVFPQQTLLTSNQIDAAKLTRINYAFANIKDGRMVEGSANDAANLAMVTALRKKHPSLTVLISVGGWGGSGGFSDMALTERSRALLIESAVAFVKQHDLDGVDIDWEYPGLPGAGHRFRPEDGANLTLLLKAMRDRLDREGKTLHRRMYLTIAAGASQQWLDHTDMAAVGKIVDRVNLMAYDYYEPTDDKLTGNHAPLFTDPADPKHISANESVLAMEKAGVPVEKIVLGVPFYGHAWAGVPQGKTQGLFQPGKAAPVGYQQYSAIHEKLKQGEYAQVWDAAASVPYLYDAKAQIFISYEDPRSLEAKCDYIKQHDLGGIMFWEYSGDPSGELLGVIDKAFRPGSR